MVNERALAHDIFSIDRTIAYLADANSRRRIATAYMAGRINGDTAMKCLIECELIEVPECE